jgi:gas vesicle protein
MAELPVDSTVSEQAQDESVSRLAWFLTGAIIGATVAILYAPKSGKDTRKYLSDRAQAGKEAVTGTTSDIVDSGREMFERGRRMVDDAAALFDRARKMVRGE